MPDLTNTELANNYNRSRDAMSSYGTRTLMFYHITINGYNINTEPGFNLEQKDAEPGNPDYYTSIGDNPYRTGSEESYLESPKSIEYPVLRGIAQVAEIMINGQFQGASGGGGHTYVTVALSMDTVADGHYMAFTDNSKRIADAIQESIAVIAPTATVTVTPQYLNGLGFSVWTTPTGSNS